jgi:ferrous iron transport protein B
VSLPVPPAAARVALAGNPNAGKTSLFNRLTGSSQKVGNYPGVTVERHSGTLRLPGGGSCEVFDIPGTYSLSARSAEEQLACQAILGLPPYEAPDLVVLVVDATQLLRNLYLALQVIEAGTRVVVALNMVDLVEASGMQIDHEGLARELGVPVVPVSGLRGTGLAALEAEIERALTGPGAGQPPRWQSSGPLEADIAAVEAALPAEWNASAGSRSRALALWSLLSVDEEDELVGVPEALRAAVLERRRLAEGEGREIEPEVIRARYAWIDAHGAPNLTVPSEARRSLTDRLDAVLLHPVAGFALFLLLMGLVFQSLFSWADPMIGGIEAGFGALADLASARLPEGILRDFVTEGLIAGVGGVVVFLPQILLLFLFIGLMEDSGYMARVAFLMDRLMRALGLHGRAFVPMLSGYACAIPAILATRTMERRRDRMITMMVVPFMSCSARLPVYTLLIAALFDPEGRALGVLPVPSLLMVGMYVFSTAVALGAAGVLGRTVFRGPRVPLILELPPYRLPQPSSVARMMWSRGSMFLREAGGVILVCTVALWGLLSFPKNVPLSVDYEAARAAAAQDLDDEALALRLAELDGEEAGERLRQSYGARVGHALEPVIAPLGYDWKMGVGLIGAFAAREVFVSTMGVVYGVGGEVDEESSSLRERLRDERRPDGRRLYTPLVGLSLMVFFALACQCMSTLAAVYRETRSLRWPVFLFVYMTGLAWITSFLVYQGGRLLGFE